MTTTQPQGPQPPKHPAVAVSAAQYAARHLQTSGRPGFEVVRVTGELIRLATPAAAFNAADYLTAAGYDAMASMVTGQWGVRVR